MPDHAAINLRILRQGAIIVDGARAHRAATGIVCVNLSLISKYAENPMFDHQDGKPPRLHLCAGAQTLKVHENVPRDMETVIEFTDYVGWQVFSCSDPARYTVALTLVAPEGGAVSADN